MFSMLDGWSVGEELSVTSGFELLSCYIFLWMQILRFGPRVRQCEQPSSHDLSGRWKQSQLSLTSQFSLLWEGSFLISTVYQRSYLLQPGCERSHYCVFIGLVVLPSEQQSASHTWTNVPICYWAWKSLGTLYEACAYIILVCSVSGPNASYKLYKAIISSAVTCCRKISQSNTLFMYISMVLLSKTCVLVLHLISIIQHCLQRLPRSLYHFITTTWKTQRKQQNSQVQFRTVCILIVTVLLCTQLFVMAIRQSKTKYAASNGTAIVLIVICSLHFSQAHPTNRVSLAEHHSSGVLLHTRDNGITSTTLTLRLKGGPNVGYCVTVAMGSVPQELCMLVDTGSANFAVAGGSQDGIDDWLQTASSSTYMELGTSINVRYTSGEWSGTLSKDMVSLGNTVPFEAYFAVIESSKNFFIDQATWVGILGLGYSSLVKPNPSKSPPVWDTFRRQTGMQDVFSLQLCPPLDILVAGGTSLQGGWMVLGGVNHSMYEGAIFNTSIVEEKFYNVLITNLTVGNTRINMKCSEFNNDKAIIDSGTTDIFLPKDVYEQVEAAFKAYFADGIPLEVPDAFWSGQSKLMWQAQHKDEIFSSFPTFHIGFSSNEDSTEGFSLAVTPQTYLRQISGTGAEISTTNITCSPCDFFTFGIKPRTQGTVIGSNMMLGFYTVFDRKNRKIGFARSKCSYRSENSARPYIEGPYPRDPVDCRYKRDDEDWELISFICAGIALPMGVVTLAVALFFRCRSHLRCNKSKPKDYDRLNNVEENNNSQKDIDISEQEVASGQPESNASEATNARIIAIGVDKAKICSLEEDEGIQCEDDSMEPKEVSTGPEHSPTDEGYGSLPIHILPHKS